MRSTLRTLPFFIGLLLPAAEGRAVPGTAPAAVAAAADPVVWRPWSNAVFAEARREHRFVLLDLGAVWCHWCHVMDQQTYGDPAVAALIRGHYLAVRVDQDSRPDLANRYADYGWPATVVFGGDGEEIVKRQGYLPPEQMRSMLQAIVDDPTPGPSVTGGGNRREGGTDSGGREGTGALREQLISGYDFSLGGWSRSHRFMDWDNLEWALEQARRGDAQAGAIARQMLAAEARLIDPVWGGVCQYSIDDWDHPHFEKLIQVEAENVRIYALAYAWLKDPAWISDARRIDGYVRAFLTGPDGAVYASQDADVVPGEPAEGYYRMGDAARRRVGIPRIDRHTYARENGWYIRAELALHAATGDPEPLREAQRAAAWVIHNRSLPGGGYCHGSGSGEPLFLGDTLAMGQACLALYASTGDPDWLARAEADAAFIRGHFSIGGGTGGTTGGPPTGVAGFATAAVEGPAGGGTAGGGTGGGAGVGGEGAEAGPLRSLPDFDENVALARFGNLLAHYAADPADREMALRALRFAASPGAARPRGGYVGGLILAECELDSDPIHVVVLGSRDDPAALRLFQAVVRHPCGYGQVEWFDPAHPPSGTDLSLYPVLRRPAAFLCANHACSSPLSDDGRLAQAIETAARAEGSQAGP